MSEILTDEKNQLFHLLKNSLWNHTFDVDTEFDWDTISKSAKEQGVTSFIYDAAKRMGLDVPAEIKQQWKNHVLSGTLQNERLLIAQNAAIRRFEQAGIAVSVLKGSSIARYYPQPELRGLGDIDLLVKKDDICTARDLLLQDGYTEDERDNGFHIAFSKRGVCLELHEQVTSFPDTPGGQAAQEIADGFLDRLDVGSVCGYTFPVLSRADQAVSLLLHMVRHMFEGGIGLRQLCDWMLFTAAEGQHFADEICPVLKRCGLLEFAGAAAKTCVIYLGLDPACCQWCDTVDERVCAMFLGVVFQGGNMGSAGTDVMGSLFTDAKSMGDNASPLVSLFRKLNGLTYKNFPFVERYRFLLPVFWLYLPIRYFIRSITGRRPKKSLKKMVGTAKKQRELFEELHLFEI